MDPCRKFKVSPSTRNVWSAVQERIDGPCLEYKVTANTVRAVPDPRT